MVVLRCNVRFTVEVDVESVCNVTLLLPSANVSMTPDVGLAEAIGVEANKLDTINNARITERVALERLGCRGWCMRVRTLTEG